MTRLSTTAGDLARLGFSRSGELAPLVDELEITTESLRRIAETGDPDSVLIALHRLSAEVPVMEQIWADEARLSRVCAVLGASSALSRHLISVPADLEVLAEEPVQSTAAEIRDRLLTGLGFPECAGRAPDDYSQLSLPSGRDELRLVYRRELLRITSRDLSAESPYELVDSIAQELSDLADAVVQCALALARGDVTGHEKVRFSVIALGKCGAQELNYISDVDVLYVYEPQDGASEPEAMEIATRIATALAKNCSAYTATGSIWQIDAALRPEGNAGPLVRTLESHCAYYEKWAEPWEFQALLKARPMAGDLELGNQFCEMVTPKVWNVGHEVGFVLDTQAMRRRVTALIPPKEADREIKLGRGGLRDVEFTVQLLQLVHGRANKAIRSAGTFPALRSLVENGYLGRSAGEELEEAYRIMRVLEHRVQLLRLRRTHLIPDNETDKRILDRLIGQDSWELWRSTASKVTELHTRAFYSPLLQAVSELTTDEINLDHDAALDRMRALGFVDGEAGLRHIAALTSGVTRRAVILRQLLPAMLGWLAEGPNPDLGLLAFRQLSEALGDSPWYLRAMRDEGSMAKRAARLLSTSRFLIDLLERDPAAIQLLMRADDLRPRDLDELHESVGRIIGRHQQADQAINAVRAFRRRELLRLGVGDILGMTSLGDLGVGLSDLASATIEAALRLAASEVDDAPAIGVVALGRWGGRELSLGSDADAMFVVAADEDLQSANQIILRARELLSRPGPDAPLLLDLGLRPEGRNGPLVRTLESYRNYYASWGEIWESQAMIRAGYGAGDRYLVNQLLEIIDDFRWPPNGLSEDEILTIRRIKLRMQNERIPKAVDPAKHLKLGPGGLSDVEWTVQYLQLQYSYQVPQLRTPNTLNALQVAEEYGLVDHECAVHLADAWNLASRIRNAILNVRGRAQDTLPANARDAAAVAMILGYERYGASRLAEEWARVSRLASKCVEKIFWGEA